MKIYKVGISFDIVVMAKDEEDARRVADRYADEQMNDLGDEVVDYVQPIDSLTQVPDWEDSIPYGSGGDQTVGEILGEDDDEG